MYKNGPYISKDQPVVVSNNLMSYHTNLHTYTHKKPRTTTTAAPATEMEALAGGKPLSARARQIAKSREELLGLLSDLPDSDHELSFTDLVESKPARGAASAEAAEAPPTTQGGGRAAEQETKKTARAGKERRRSRRSDSRGSCGGGGDGVLLNFYVPGLLTRSMTAPRPGRGQAVPGVPTVAAAGKAIMEAPPAVGCWTALWGRGRDRRKPMKPAERRDLRVSA